MTLGVKIMTAIGNLGYCNMLTDSKMCYMQ